MGRVGCVIVCVNVCVEGMRGEGAVSRRFSSLGILSQVSCHLLAVKRGNRFFGLSSKISIIDEIFLPIVGMYKNNWVYTCNEYTTMCFSKFSTISTILWEGDE